MSELVVGYDGSECAKAALEVAIELAQSLGDGIVIAYADAPPHQLVGEEWKAHRDELHEVGEHATREALARVENAALEAEVSVLTERPAAALLHLAHERAARMILVGTHGESPIAGALLGSVPHKLLHRSSIPVLVVPATG
jgi:nucleotide-binding universal stress UspA family protein